jgi:orotidine-5'-phosphate decarboxylase
MEHFGDRLMEAVKRKKTPAMVGIDPRPDLLPKALTKRFALVAGASPGVWARAVEEFCSRVLDVVSPYVPAVKFQSAFFELYGAPGISALSALLRKAHRLGLVTLLDAKRADIGSTSQAYAEAVFGRLATAIGRGAAVGPIAHAVTVNPYLGRDSLDPFVEYARQFGYGIFVLVRTSNPGSRDLQQIATDAGDSKVFQLVARWVGDWSLATRGRSGYGCVGAVVGATAGDQIVQLRAALPGSWLLIPGYGAQGATALDIAGAMDDGGFGAIVNSSRGVLFPTDGGGPDIGERWEQAIDGALKQMIDELARSTAAARLQSS